MSHVVTLRGEFTSKDLMRAAFERLGGVWHEGCTKYEQYYRHVGDYPLPHGFLESDLKRCHHMVSFEGCYYQVGIYEIDRMPPGHPAHTVRGDDGELLYPPGTIIPIFDFIDSGLKSRLGGVELSIGDMQAIGLMNAYNIEKARLELTDLGYSNFTEVVEEDGSLTLEVIAENQW